jgi:hypothetical protein
VRDDKFIFERVVSTRRFGSDEGKREVHVRRRGERGRMTSSRSDEIHES